MNSPAGDKKERKNESRAAADPALIYCWWGWLLNLPESPPSQQTRQAGAQKEQAGRQGTAAVPPTPMEKS